MDTIELDPNAVVAGLLERISQLTLETVQLRVLLATRDKQLTDATSSPTHTLHQGTGA